MRHVTPCAIAALLVVFVASSVHAGDNCESIRAGIDAKIRAAGAKTFSLSTVPVDARTAGKVVGSCAQGAKKIVYVQDAPAGQARPTPPDEPILTECKDGSVSVGGACGK